MPSLGHIELFICNRALCLSITNLSSPIPARILNLDQGYKTTQWRSLFFSLFDNARCIHQAKYQTIIYNSQVSRPRHGPGCSTVSALRTYTDLRSQEYFGVLCRSCYISWNLFRLILFGQLMTKHEKVHLKLLELMAWWRHQMETFSALLAICAGNSPVTGIQARYTEFWWSLWSASE